MSSTDTGTDTIPRPNRLILQPVSELDPRLGLDERALVEASRNAWPVVARSPKARGDGAGLAAGACAALLLGGITFWSMSDHRHPAALPPPAPVRAEYALAPSPIVQPSAPARSFMPAPLPQAGLVQTAPGMDRAHSPVMVFDTSTSSVPSTQAVADRGLDAGPRARGGSGGSGSDPFADRVGDGSTDVATATALANPATTITQGTLIPAVLETAINTDLPGYVRAVVSRDVRSFDGSRVLVPRSSRLIGQYKSGLAAGQTRAYVIWTRLIRPDGASVALGSPSVDQAGRSGMDGKVDGHFMKRFGSAMLLSVVGGLSAIGNASVVLSGGQSAASVAAGHDSNIPPTVRVDPGEPIRVFTAKDLDFSTVDSASTADAAGQ